MTLVRNDSYWGKKPAIQKLNLKFITDPNTMLLAIRSHQVDGTFKVPQDQIADYKSLSGVNVSLVPEQLAAYYSLDVEDPPFTDIHVRRALAYATDKAGMVKAVLRGYGQRGADDAAAAAVGRSHVAGEGSGALCVAAPIPLQPCESQG